MSQSTQRSTPCIFCNIISGDAPGNLLFEDDNYVVIKDIKPAAKHHYLIIPRNHILDVNNLSTADHRRLLEELIVCGKKFLGENGGDLDDSRLGFHVPPFNSIAHLHLHVISPASQMSFISRCIFKPNTWWFQTVSK
ncbi:unnamed protein product [Phaedon cochleariae]|uniref:Adenosine 5'-monophosphoramidase HINT3 n=1 Tax=Phaedon cochleariae TaxID=80249 RepID=A0A9N9X7Q0_PHACE|nr:unnamed protein product [Phaedon cochleariae]